MAEGQDQYSRLQQGSAPKINSIDHIEGLPQMKRGSPKSCRQKRIRHHQILDIPYEVSMNNKKASLVLAGSILLLASWVVGGTSCVRKPLPNEYFSFQKVEHSCWQAGKQYKFEILVPDYNKRYSASLILRHSNHYKYKQIRLRAYLLDTRDQLIWGDTISIPLAFKELRWAGRGISQIETSVPFFRAKRLSHSGIYHISLTPDLHQAQLDGVEAVGLRFWQSSPDEYPSANED